MDLNFITISSHPALKNKGQLNSLKEFDIIINVSDHIDFHIIECLCENKIQHYWLPLGEAFSMPLENIYAAMYVLWNADKKDKKVLLHCMAGRNRSRMIKDCYRLMTTGAYEEDSSLVENIKDNQLPGIYRMEIFLQKCLEVFEKPSIADKAMIDWIKKETLYVL